MPEYIFTTKEELMEIVREAVSDIFSIKQSQKPIIDTIDFNSTLKLINEHGYKMTKSQLYKLTSRNAIPYMKFGNKLVFSNKEILEWLRNKTTHSKNKDDVMLEIQKALKTKNKGYISDN